jgi:hypothetical protein
MRQQVNLSERQSRVGIIANPAVVPLPAPGPSSLMSRWPDLRSPRRLRHHGVARPDVSDPITAGHALAEFAQELRQRPLSRGVLHRLTGLFGLNGEARSAKE